MAPQDITPVPAIILQGQDFFMSVPERGKMKTFKKVATKVAAVLAAATMALTMSACRTKTPNVQEAASYVVGICNYVDDASLNQIVENIQSKLDEIANEKGVSIEIKYQNCNADANVLNQIVSKFISDKVDLMIGVATPVAMAMQAQTEDNKIPVVFSAVSDPLSTGLVASMEAPGANITGTSDMLNTESIMNMMLAYNPDMKKVGLLYDMGQDASTMPIEQAKAFFEGKGIEVVERTGTTVDEVTLAAEALVSAGVEAVFTPTDNTIMTAELSIYETFRDAKIPHYCGADSFALNGAFLGFGVNYADLGKETAVMAADILIGKKNPGEVAVKTFDNGIVTLNEDIMAAFGDTKEDLTAKFEAYASLVQTLKTAESFE